MEPKRDGPERRMLALPQGHHMMIEAASPQIGDALLSRHEIKPPDGRIELLRPADIRRFEIDAAQCRDWKMGHCGRRSPSPCRPFFQCRRCSRASHFLRPEGP